MVETVVETVVETLVKVQLANLNLLGVNNDFELLIAQIQLNPQC